ncbi:MAG: hypothetical protein ACYDAH_20195 [Steroidobacteraceae bacterium]
MSELQNTVAKMIGSKNVHRSAGAIAGFASALSVIVGTLAGYATPSPYYSRSGLNY